MLYCILWITILYLSIGGAIFYFYQYQREKRELNLSEISKENRFLNDINYSLASFSLSYKERIEQICNQIKIYYNALEVIVTIFEDEVLEVINYDKVNRDIIPNRSIFFNKQNNSIEKFIINDFIEEIEYKYHKFNNKEMINFSINSDKSKKPIGILTIVFNNKSSIDKKKIYDFLHLISKNIAFNTHIEREEKALLETIRSRKKEEILSKELNNVDIFDLSQLKNRLSLEIKRVERYNSTLSAINFKLFFISEEFRKIEISIIELIQKSIREVDMFGLWEDDSYLIILPETNIFGAKQVVRKIKNRILETSHISEDNINFAVSEYNLDNNDDEGTFIKRLQSSLKKSEKYLIDNMIIEKSPKKA